MRRDAGRAAGGVDVARPLRGLCRHGVVADVYAHEGSKRALLGGSYDDADLAGWLSNENQVTADTPPAFLWHTVDDQSVAVEHSLGFAQALRRNAVPFELHLFESGVHGLGLAESHAEARAWPGLCEAWLRRRGFIG